MYYRNELVVSNYESDAKNLLRPSGMLRYMQQTSAMQLVERGQSGQELYEKGMAFLLTKVNMKVHRGPTCAEKISIGTAATPPKGVRFIREFIIDCAQGQRLVSCLSLWVLVDVQNHKILRPDAYPYTLGWEEPSLDETVGDIAIPAKFSPDAQTWHTRREIYYSHIDTNAHVNNSVYADFVCDALPHDLLSRGLTCLTINYRKEAKRGDTLEIETGACGENSYRVVGTNAGAPCFEAYLELG